jgi:hypothetical protein
MASTNLPEHLQSFDNLSQNFRAELKGLNSKSKGDKFEKFVKGLIPETDIGVNFESPEIIGKPGDGGVDLLAEGKDGQSKLYVQAKLTIDRVEDIDQIIRKFSQWHAQKYQPTIKGGQTNFLSQLEIDNERVFFLVITLSPIRTLLKKYETQSLSHDFYRKWVDDRQLSFVDGYDIWKILQADFLKRHEAPSRLVLNLDAAPIVKDNVFLSIVSSDSLRQLHRQFGNALFFENVRDFQGIVEDEQEGRTSPNKEIVKTIRQDPIKLLERNNGIVFKAKRVEPGDNEKQLILVEGSVVNGCQTTVCISEYAEQTCYVPVKIVEALDSENQWEIAQAANYQNQINIIDLRLARSIRPQIVERAAAIAQLGVDREERSAFQLMDQIYERRVAYEEIRLLYIGLFSKKPNNVVSSNYTELDYYLVDQFFDDDPYGQEVFEALFQLQRMSQQGLAESQGTFTNKEYAPTFERFYKQGAQYRCFVSLLAICALFNMNLENDEAPNIEKLQLRKDLISKIRTQLVARSKEFIFYYKMAVKVWMDAISYPDDNEEKTRRNMNRSTKQTSFTYLIRKVLSEADLHKSIGETKTST